MTEAAEFHQIYKLGVVPIPTNRPMVRAGPARPRLQDRGGQVRRRRRGHRRAPRARPAGAGRHDQRREERVPLGAAHEARRPRTRCSTPSSTSARRRSSPRPGARARSRSRPTWPAAAPTSCSAATRSSSPSPSCAATGLDPAETPEEYEAAWPEALEQAQQAVAAEHDEVVDLGGLYVLGTERHESRRIDNQLRGRSGRQGDPGESRFYLSLHRRPHAAVQLRHGRVAADRAPASRTTCRSSRRWSPGRSRARRAQVEAPQLRDPQERAEVRRRPEPPARGHLRRAPPGARGRGPARAGPPLHRRRRRPPTSPRRPREGFAEDWDLDQLWPALRHALPGVGSPSRRSSRRPAAARRPHGRAARRADARTPSTPTTSARTQLGDEAHARARAPRRALGAGPQVARAPLRDGLPAGGHRAAGDGPARPAGGVPARGLPAVPGDDRGHQGGVGRLPVQPRGAGRAAGRRRHAGESGTAAGHGGLVAKGLGAPSVPRSLQYSAPRWTASGRRGPLRGRGADGAGARTAGSGRRPAGQPRRAPGAARSPRR